MPISRFRESGLGAIALARLLDEYLPDAMKWRLALLAGISLLPQAVVAQDAALGKMIGESREVAGVLLKRVGGEMRREMEASSPTSAVLVCKYSSPEIASELSRKTGWRISRVSLKPRNPAIGTADAWEQKVLADFDRRAAAGEKPEALEHAAIVDEPGGKFFRYMKALPVSSLCLTCHGPTDKMPTVLRTRINTEYPHDKAVGYSVGEVRGAVTIKRPL